jgi:hypothetical protein
MTGSPRNLHHRTMVPADKTSLSSRHALAWTPSGEHMASPRGKNKGVKKLRKIIGNKKGIQTILAALLMVVIVVVASVMVYAWSTGLLGSLLVTPTAGKEALNADTYSFYNTTMASINIRNSGTVAVTLVTYYVKDSSQNTYTNTAFTAAQSAPQSLQPNAVWTTNFDINTIGNHCGCSGATFTFTSGSYTVTVVTSRNNQFVFTLIK